MQLVLLLRRPWSRAVEIKSNVFNRVLGGAKVGGSVVVRGAGAAPWLAAAWAGNPHRRYVRRQPGKAPRKRTLLGIPLGFAAVLAGDDVGNVQKDNAEQSQPYPHPVHPRRPGGRLRRPHRRKEWVLRGGGGRGRGPRLGRYRHARFGHRGNRIRRLCRHRHACRRHRRRGCCCCGAAGRRGSRRGCCCCSAACLRGSRCRDSRGGLRRVRRRRRGARSSRDCCRYFFGAIGTPVPRMAGAHHFNQPVVAFGRVAVAVPARVRGAPCFARLAVGARPSTFAEAGVPYIRIVDARERVFVLWLHARVRRVAGWVLASLADVTVGTVARKICDCPNALAAVQACTRVNPGQLQLVKPVLDARVDQPAVFADETNRAFAIKVFQHAGEAFATILALVAQLAVDVCERTARCLDVVAKDAGAAGVALPVLIGVGRDRLKLGAVVAGRPDGCTRSISCGRRCHALVLACVLAHRQVFARAVGGKRRLNSRVLLVGAHRQRGARPVCCIARRLRMR